MGSTLRLQRVIENAIGETLRSERFTQSELTWHRESAPIHHFIRIYPAGRFSMKRGGQFRIQLAASIECTAATSTEPAVTTDFRNSTVAADLRLAGIDRSSDWPISARSDFNELSRNVRRAWDQHGQQWFIKHNSHESLLSWFIERGHDFEAGLCYLADGNHERAVEYFRRFARRNGRTNSEFMRWLSFRGVETVPEFAAVIVELAASTQAT